MYIVKLITIIYNTDKTPKNKKKKYAGGHLYQIQFIHEKKCQNTIFVLNNMLANM